MPLKEEGHDFSRANQALGDDYERLLFNYLRISPSYALICESNGQKITRSTPEFSRRIIHTFQKFGDVYSLHFVDWLGSHRAVSQKTTAPNQALLITPGQTVTCPPGYQGVLFPTVSTAVERAKICSQLQKRPMPSKSYLSDPIIRSKTLWKALAAVYERAKHPEIELWRVALLANVVDRLKGKLDPWGGKKAAKDAELRRHLTLMVVRALFLALIVSENAAQGFFPTRAEVPGEQLEFPFAQLKLHGLLSSQGDAEYLAIIEHC